MSDPLNTKYKFSTGSKKKQDEEPVEQCSTDKVVKKVITDNTINKKSVKGINNINRKEEPINIEKPKKTTVHPQPDDRVSELEKNVVVNNTFLPQAIHLEDIDRGVQETIKRDFQIEIQGKNVPILEISHALWSQFTKTWKISDKSKNAQLPFITMVRQPVAEIGTTNGTYYMPNNGHTYTVHNQKELINGKQQNVSYKIAQPTYVDINYTLSIFCTRQRDINKLNERVIKLFQSREHSVLVKGRYMPLILESIEDASQQNLNERRFFKQVYQLKLQGYIIDENDMEVVVNNPAKLKLNVKVENKKKGKFLNV